MDSNMGAVIKNLRKNKGVTQDELANVLNVSNQSVSKWETGQANPDVAYIPKIAEFFEVSIDTLFGYAAEMPREDYRRKVSAKDGLLSSDDLDALVDMWQSLHMKYPNDGKVERELIAAMCRKNDLNAFEEIFYHVVRLLRTNQNHDIEDAVLHDLRIFLQSVMKREESRNRETGVDMADISQLLAVGGYLTKDMNRTGDGDKLTLLPQSDIDRILDAFGRPTPPAPSGKNVLIVDDAPVMRMMLRQIAEGAGFTVAGEAADGKEGCDMTRDLRPDVVLMDITMPVMDGLAATEKILEQYPETPVIIISALCNAESVSRAARLSAFDFIAKPFDDERVLKSLDRLYQG